MSTDLEIRERLHRAWFALFAHHPKLTPIQREAIPPLLDGREGLLCAPTASGKTEAMVAHVFEALTLSRGEGIRALYVCPTRALVNDAWRRLEPPAGRLRIEIGRRTGDHRPGRGVSHLLLTTPESLDSMLARMPATLKHVRWLILDELHQLAGTARGDHLASLVWRVRHVARAAGHSVQVVAASATVAHPDEIAHRYLSHPVVLAVGSDTTERAHPDIVDIAGVGDAADPIISQPGKTLVFANARNQVEALAHGLRGLPPFGDSVFAHHGSLDRAERLRVEKAFLARRHAICVATSTLELGIDIGDVDRVVLYGPPPDVSSYVQRLGRGGRRSGRVAAVLLARASSERRRFEFFIDRAAAGDLCADLWPYHPSTVLRLAGSLMMQNRRRVLTVEALVSRLPPWQSRHWTVPRLAAVLDARDDWFVRQEGGAWGVGDELAWAFDRGTLHSQIEDDAGVAVVDALTERTLGTVSRAKVGHKLVRAGRGSRVISERKREVRVAASNVLIGPAKFVSRGAPVISRADATAWLRYLGGAPPAAYVVGAYWIHGLGMAIGRVLALALSRSDRRVLASGGLAWSLDEPSVPPDDINTGRIEAAIDELSRPLARLTGQGPDFAHLPADERRRALELALPPEELRQAYLGLRWSNPDPELALRLIEAIEG